MVVPEFHEAHILIIGAGPGGLVLAQCLKRMGISFEIFEREDGPRMQGWAVALIESLEDLKEMLPSDIYANLPTCSVNYGSGLTDRLALIDGITGETAGVVGDGKPFLRAGRQGLRAVLREGLDVQMAKVFTHYEVIPGQGVIAHFEDGTTAKGTLLVGADGSRSHVRSQLLQNENPLIQSQFVNVVGELDLSPDVYKPIEELGSAGVLVYRPGLRYLIGRLGIDSELQISKYYWAACAASDTPVKDSEWVANAPKEELYKRGVETTKGLPSFLTDIVRATSANQMLQPPLRFVEFHFNGDESLPLADHVTVLGDAAHTMVPFFLAGANSAVKDACDLAKALQKFPGRAGLRRAQETYESIMVKRSKEMVLKSRAQGELDNLNQVLERVK
ncbi:uncharacterized protein TRUGW13939_00121 [Talaromyces rugulosus]|uniref:FAD-binding domain-containing protein n=1 Tax=Talaromyces rugulosus TaxID=121627 RepID=A0A7H8QGF9_TALRU|nr:uncharacterized protein TRUGW13939_00121 [Talaromyces rugulosus]QKX53050.1 hypothetical protein TRUGW13939_00121 [Talaromyces rugulosus]